MRIAIISIILLVTASVSAQSADHTPLLERLRLCPNPTVAGLVHCALEPANPKELYPFDPENADIWNPELYKLNAVGRTLTKNWWNAPNLTGSPAVPATVPTSPPGVQRGAMPHTALPGRRADGQGERRSGVGTSMAPHVITKAPAMVAPPNSLDFTIGAGRYFRLHLPGRQTSTHNPSVMAYFEDYQNA
jgi:hypothetical protein